MNYISNENYFDYAASAPPYEEALKKFIEISAIHYANPSAAHDEGFSCFNMLQNFKKEFCSLLKRENTELILTSCGTEANNLVIHGHMISESEAKLLIAADVHPSIRFALDWYSDNSELLPINSNGDIDLKLLDEMLSNKITLLCISHVCNETGKIHPVDKISRICIKRGVKLLIDGVQAVGHIDTDLSELRDFYYTFSAHKFGGPRGAGGIITDNTQLEAVNSGGKQEKGLRAGTENIAAFGAALEALKIALRELPDLAVDLKVKTKILRQQLNQRVEGIVFNTDENSSLPGLLSVSVPGLSASSLLTDMSLCGYSMSSGSSCHSNQVIPPKTITAMGRKDFLANGTLRISMGRYTSQESLERFTEELIGAIERSRS